MGSSDKVVEILTAPHNFDDSFDVYSLLFKAQQILGPLDINCSEAVVQKFCSVGTGASARQKFVQEARFAAPRFLRVIDCKESLQQQKVVIVDCPLDLQAAGDHYFLDLQPESEPPFGPFNAHYTAISHTYGQDVYEVFNCGCAADRRARVPRADPAKSDCNGIRHDSPDLQQKTIADLLLMCKLLVELAAVRYAWHDGVCIAQHDEEEVRHFIQHIAWIYANADDTVIFLHYIGRPMAPIAPPSYEDGIISRWQTRVWTFQEAAVSKCRRYCVRMGTASIKDSDEEFESSLASWYEPAGLDSICILEEHQFFELCMDIFNNFYAADGIFTRGPLPLWSERKTRILQVSAFQDLRKIGRGDCDGKGVAMEAKEEWT